MNERMTYWLGGVSATPWMTWRRGLRVGLLALLGLAVLFWVATTRNPWGLLALGVVVAATWVAARRRTGTGGSWLATVTDRARTRVATAAGWDTWDPTLSGTPFWLTGASVMAVSAHQGGGEVGLFYFDGAYSAVLEIDGTGDGLRSPQEHSRIERRFLAWLRAVAQPGLPVCQVDVVTRAVPAPGDEHTAWVQSRLIDGLPPAVVASMTDLTGEAVRTGERFRSYLVIRMPSKALADQARDQGVDEFTDETVPATALATVGRVVRLATAHGMRVIRALSADEAAALIRSILVPSFDAEDVDGVDDYWAAWAPYSPAGDQKSVVARGPAGDQWWHATGTIPLDGWPSVPVLGRWLEALLFDADVPNRTIVTQYQLMAPYAASQLARSQLTTAAAKRHREQSQGQSSTGETEEAESAATVIAGDMIVRGHAGIIPVVRVMVSAPTARLLGRYRESVTDVAHAALLCQQFAWDDGRHALGLLHVLPLGLEAHR